MNAKMRNLIAGLALGALLYAGTAFGEGAPNGQSSGVLKLHNRSSFNAIEVRNPFWPIGYDPKAAAPPTPANPEQPAAKQMQIKPEDFSVTSISNFGGSRMATVCGKPVMEGDHVKVSLGGQPAKVQVAKITDGTVVLRYSGQEVTVVLKRTDLDLSARPVKPEPRLHSQEE